MTLEQHRQRIRQLELRLHIADYGLGMPRDFATVLMLTAELATARKELAAAELDAAEGERSRAGLPVDIINHFIRKAKEQAELDMIASDGVEQ